MASLMIEQKLQEHGYQRGDAAQAAPNQFNLGGFAVSFEDLLQRVGTRLEHAFSPAERADDIPVSNENANVGNDARDYAQKRDGAGARNDHRNNDDAADHARSTAADARDNGTERSADTPRSDNVADNADNRGDNGDRDAQGARDTKDTSERGSTDDTAKSETGNETTADAKGDGNTTENTTENGTQSASTEGAAGQNATQQGQNTAQAAAVYAAGLIAVVGSENTKTAQGGAQTQAQAQTGVDITENTAVQAAAAKSAKSGTTDHSNASRGQKGQAKAANGAEQKVEGADQKAATSATQNQAQQLSRVIGGDTRTNINVNVTNEQSQLTSKPIFTITNGSVLTQDAGNGKGNASNAGTGQQQGQTPGQNPGQSQQAQLATQQQAQAAQQANAQNGQQGAQTVAGQGAASAGASAQASSGGAQHAGSNEAMNNATQSSNIGQQTQQTQQSRESAPQQQAQHAQRGNLPGSAVTEQISVKITKAMQSGTDRISIQLKPAELGRVDVKMEMTHDGRVMTVVTAEKQDTLDLLRRDSAELQKALADAGLTSGDMEFNLKGQEQQSAQSEGDDKGNSATAEADAEETEADVNDGVMSAWESGIFVNGKLDMRA